MRLKIFPIKSEDSKEGRNWTDFSIYFSEKPFQSPREDLLTTNWIYAKIKTLIPAVSRAPEFSEEKKCFCRTYCPSMSLNVSENQF